MPCALWPLGSREAGLLNIRLCFRWLICGIYEPQDYQESKQKPCYRDQQASSPRDLVVALAVQVGCVCAHWAEHVCYCDCHPRFL
jgi:hypothetical protein